MSDYDMSIHHNRDAAAWAKFFMETWEKNGRPQPNEEMMLGWFANAMMAMHDTSRDPRMLPQSDPATREAEARGWCHCPCGKAGHQQP